jgi:hypothetical protein
VGHDVHPRPLERKNGQILRLLSGQRRSFFLNKGFLSGEVILVWRLVEMGLG